ncbi:MAG: bacterial transcriptional activator domain-containing protein [Tissierellia bacterium]|jgi:DNA-binding SARP family transcriptional activator|nr:bacterial transcriptional activator domain-containing protein [Tissierellia bacterium]
MTDLQKFERLWKQAQQDIPIPQKVHTLKHAIKLYKGHVLGTACDDLWLVGIATDYKMKYITMVNELLSIFAEFEDYDAVHHFATKALKLVPENVKAQYWLVYAIYHSGVITLAKKEIQQAKSRLTAEEFETLQKFICKDESLPYGQLFDE